MEEWRPIRDYEGLYEVSNLGRVRSLDKVTIDNIGRKQYFKGCIMKLQCDRDGYLYVSLTKEGCKKKFKIHRLVAEAFIPNPDNKPTVDHINTIRTDNTVANLKWTTNKENSNNVLTRKHISKSLLGENHPLSKKIVQLSLDGELIKIWNSMGEAEREKGFCKTSISKVCIGKQKQHKGYKWMYYEDYDK